MTKKMVRSLMSFLIAMAFLCLGITPTTAKANEVDWGELNPTLKDAVYVEEAETCSACHDDYIEAFDKTKHARVFKYGNNPKENVCQSCHGPASKHLDKFVEGLEELQDTEDPQIFSFLRTDSSEKKGAACLQCHETKKMEWESGLHRVAGVSCNSCHYVSERKSDQSLFVNEDVKAACYTCHTDKMAQNLRASHMPIREGKMECQSCHNPHGTPYPHMLNTASVNDTCYSCHAEKRGPFIWEHAVVRENCSNCHDPHGTNNPGLLKAKGAFLCTQCHQYGGHINLPRYNRVSSPYGQGCINCHTRIHGSNHPSGAKLTR